MAVKVLQGENDGEDEVGIVEKIFSERVELLGAVIRAKACWT